VLLDEKGESVQASADGSFAVECLRGGKQEVFYSSQPVAILPTRGLLTVNNARGEVIRDNLDEVNIIPRGAGNRVRFGQRKYRGLLRFLPRGEVVRVVNVVYMEDYLRGVVPRNRCSR
jgi:peptidoglycan hydrolase-like amidase